MLPEILEGSPEGSLRWTGCEEARLPVPDQLSNPTYVGSKRWPASHGGLLDDERQSLLP